MRKIISKHKEEKKKKRNGMIIGIILIGVMLLSILGYSFQSQSTTESETDIVVYNGFEFIEQSSFWFVNTGEFQFLFKYNPTEVENTKRGLNKLSNYNAKVLYISSDCSDARLEIYRNLFYKNNIILRMQSACLEGEECEGDLPVKNCEDNFIIITNKENERILQEDNCVFIEGAQENLTRLTDEFLFEIIGIQ